MVDYSQKQAGIYFETYDNSQYSTTGTTFSDIALITPTVKGKAFYPRTVTSMAEYSNYFGTTFKSGSQYYEYQGSLLAQNYFDNAGTSILVVPVKSGTYAPATSTALNVATGSVFTLETLSDGSVLNNAGGEILNSSGSLINGTVDNIRWEISNVSVAKGTFDLLIRRGNDNAKSKDILETYVGVSLDPMHPNYIAKAIGDTVYNYDSTNQVLQKSGSYPNVSKYVRVASNVALPDYLDNNGVAKTTFTGSLPVVASGSFASGSDGTLSHPQLFFENISSVNSQGFTPTTDAYAKAIGLLSNKNDYKFNTLYLSGITANTHPAIFASAVNLIDSRDDIFGVLDLVEDFKQPADVISVASGYDTPNVASYYPHMQISSRGLNRDVWCLPSTLFAGVYAYSDSISSPAFAPAGYDRASLNSVKDVRIKIGGANQGALFNGNVNLVLPINNTFVCLSQNTLLQKSTARDRINVVRLMGKIKRYLLEEGNKMLFQPLLDRNKILLLDKINTWFGILQTKGEVYSAKAIDVSNVASNDRSEFPIIIEIVPAKGMEKIIFQLNIENQSSVTFNTI